MIHPVIFIVIMKDILECLINKYGIPFGDIFIVKIHNDFLRNI